MTRAPSPASSVRSGCFRSMPGGLRARWTMRAPADTPSWPGLEPLPARVLAARGLTRLEDARAFLKPSLGDLHDPSLLPGVDAAAERVLRALRDGEPLAIYGDYDADGVTATAVLFHTLRALASDSDVRTFVPHRIDDGYGLNSAALEQLAAEGARVVVSVDCGITAVREAARARELGLSLLITDHHALPPAGSPLPDAEVLVHPRLPGSVYPFADLSGVGVAFKLAWRLATLHHGQTRASPELREILLGLLPIVAIGTVADVVPLHGENRALVSAGLARMGECIAGGLGALIDAARLDDRRIDAHRIAFVLAPRLNACGRLGHARDAVRLLTTATPPQAAEIAAMLCTLNEERRDVERRITEQAEQQAIERGMTGEDRRAIVLASPQWHPGVVGIAASRLVERFHRPTILLCEEQGMLAGSARSVPGYDLAAALHRCSAHLSSHGGHAMAAGLRLEANRLDAFAEALIDDANTRLRREDLAAVVSVDCEAQARELSVRASRQLEAMAPFGAGNARACVLLRGLRIAQPPRPLGKQGRHIALTLESASRAEGIARSLRVVGWDWAEHAEGLRRGQVIDCVVEPKVSEFAGVERAEPVLIDVAPWPADSAEV